MTFWGQKNPTVNNDRNVSQNVRICALTQAARQGLSARIRFASANRIFNLAVCFRNPRYRVFRKYSSCFTTAKTCSTLARTEDFSRSLRLICALDRLELCLLWDGQRLICPAPDCWNQRRFTLLPVNCGFKTLFTVRSPHSMYRCRCGMACIRYLGHCHLLVISLVWGKQYIRTQDCPGRAVTLFHDCHERSLILIAEFNHIFEWWHIITQVIIWGYYSTMFWFVQDLDLIKHWFNLL